MLPQLRKLVAAQETLHSQLTTEVEACKLDKVAAVADKEHLKTKMTEAQADIITLKQELEVCVTN